MADLRFLWCPRDLETKLAHCQAGCVSFLCNTRGAKQLQALAAPHKATSSPRFSLPFVVGRGPGRAIAFPRPPWYLLVLFFRFPGHPSPHQRLQSKKGEDSRGCIEDGCDIEWDLE